MPSAGVVLDEESVKTAAEFAGRRVIFDIDIFILYCSPEAFSENVVHATPATIHADVHLCCQKRVNVAMSGKLAALIAVGDMWYGSF